MTAIEISHLPPKANKILSIQSHVVHGYVGNKAATFPLQTLNWDVDVLNSVNFSNHTGYGAVEGECFLGKDIQDVFSGLRSINMNYDAMLTGYIHGANTLDIVGRECMEIKRRNEQALWLLDPVMGDEGQLYVNKNVIPIYRKILRSGLVDIITPNQFELEVLLGHKIHDLQSLRQAVKHLHDVFDIKYVVISSLSLSGEQLGLKGNRSNKLYCCVSACHLQKLVFFEIDKYDSYFTGVGDLFSALLLDRVFRSHDILQSTNEVLTIMSKVLYVTRELCIKHLGKDVKAKIGDFNSMKECELRIVECIALYGQRDCDYEPFEL
ncbi:hypothetical protein HII13_005281 [Brettanomyces bruxellensis]|nr:hypothetical protein HII13_005281 [Brettanomyces bruxellensis]